MRYNLAIARELPLFRAIPYAITIDGVRHDTAAMLVVVGNGPSYGGGMRVCPDALLDDGLADVMILHELSTLEFLKVFPKVFRGAHVGHPLSRSSGAAWSPSKPRASSPTRTVSASRRCR